VLNPERRDKRDGFVVAKKSPDNLIGAVAPGARYPGFEKIAIAVAKNDALASVKA